MAPLPHQASEDGAAPPIAGSVFEIGGRSFTIPLLTPWQLRDIQLSGRNANLADPLVRAEVALRDIFMTLLPAAPDLSLAWLRAHLTSPVAKAIYANIIAQVQMARAAQRAPTASAERKDN
jgi:hypothetical protein